MNPEQSRQENKPEPEHVSQEMKDIASLGGTVRKMYDGRAKALDSGKKDHADAWQIHGLSVKILVWEKIKRPIVLAL